MKILFSIFRALLIVIYLMVLFYVWGFGPVLNFWMRLGLTLVGVVLIEPVIRRVLKIRSLQHWCVLLVVVIVLTALRHEYVKQQFLTRLFEVFIVGPKPKDIRLVQGDRGRWLDPDTYLVFKTSEEGFMALTKGYGQLDWRDAWPRLERFFGMLRKNFSAKGGVRGYYKVDYEKTEISGKPIRQKREYFLFWDGLHQHGYFWSPYVTYEEVKK